MEENDSLLLAKKFIETTMKFKKTFNHGKDASDLKRNEFMLLMKMTDRLTDDVTSIKATELSTILDITPAAVTHVLNSLEEKGYIERLADKKDRRIVLVRPTENGLSTVERGKHLFFERITKLMSHLGEEDSKELIRILDKIVDYNTNQ